MEKILITGTGRSGTTFLMIILTLLKMDTGFDINNYDEYISRNCNSGLEFTIDFPYKIIKNPCFIYEIDKIIFEYKIKYVIIPIRENDKVSMSRFNNGKYNGGLWNATDLESQINFNNKIIYDYIHLMTKYDIPTIFINFEKMISDSKYLYNKLSPILDNIMFEEFDNAFILATENQKREKEIINNDENIINIENNNNNNNENDLIKKDDLIIKDNLIKNNIKDKIKNNKNKENKIKKNNKTKKNNKN